MALGEVCLNMFFHQCFHVHIHMSMSNLYGIRMGFSLPCVIARVLILFQEEKPPQSKEPRLKLENLLVTEVSSPTGDYMEFIHGINVDNSNHEPLEPSRSVNISTLSIEYGDVVNPKLPATSLK